MTLPFVKRSDFDAISNDASRLWAENSTLQSELNKVKAELAHQSQRAQELETQLRRAVVEGDHYRDRYEEAASEARSAVRMVADWMAERQFGTKIFGSNGPALGPEPPLMDQLEYFNKANTGRRRARDVVREGQEKFLQDLRAAAQPPTEADFASLMPAEIKGLNG